MRAVTAALGFLLACTLLSRAGGPQAAEMPTFLSPGDVFCPDEFDFNAFHNTGRFHTRGGTESCVTVQSVARAVLIRRAGPDKALVRVVQGPLSNMAGWTNSRLPLIDGR